VFDASQDGSMSQATTRIRWNQLSAFLGDRLATHINQSAQPANSDFTPFAETALEPLAIAKDFPAYIDLFRKQPTLWDQAFQLYSALNFWRS
jgi:hypothetical protein